MENQQYHVNQLDDPIQEHRRRILVMIRKRRRLRDYSNPFDITVVEFNALYRMPQHIMVELINILEPYVRRRVSRLSVPFYMKVLCSVAFYASGSYQRPVGEGVNHNIAQGTVSKCVKEITNALNHADILTRFIHLPDTIEERNIVIDRNALLGMPKTLGYVDGTLVKIVPPPRPNQHYRCRKGYPAINVLIFCNSSLEIMYCNARFPGSSTDPYIYRNSPLRDALQVAYWENNCISLGDSAFPHEPWMMTPLELAPYGTPEYSYNKLHMKCRNVVERCIGVLKNRFRCLLTDRTLHYTPGKAGQIANACVVLHNFLVARRVHNPPPIFEDLGNDVAEPDFLGLPLIAQADAMQQLLIDHAHNLWLHDNL